MNVPQVEQPATHRTPHVGASASNSPKPHCGNRGCLGEYLSLAAMRRHLAEAEAQGERREVALEEWIRRAAEALSIGLATVENLFDPERIIVGGAAPAALLERLVEVLGTLRPFSRWKLKLTQLRSPRSVRRSGFW